MTEQELSLQAYLTQQGADRAFAQVEAATDYAQRADAVAFEVERACKTQNRTITELIEALETARLTIDALLIDEPVEEVIRQCAQVNLASITRLLKKRQLRGEVADADQPVIDEPPPASDIELWERGHAEAPEG